MGEVETIRFFALRAFFDRFHPDRGPRCVSWD